MNRLNISTSPLTYENSNAQSLEAYSPNSEHFYDRIQSMSTTSGHDPQEYEIPPATVLLDEYKKKPSTTEQTSTTGISPKVTRTDHGNDPMTMHLLVETAVADSQDYEILSIDGLDAMKKEQRVLRRRVETLRSKLQLEIKVRDSAQSLFSLFPDQDVAPQKRRSLLGSRNSGSAPRSPSYQKAKDELAKSVRVCEDLAKEIWTCEKQQRDLEDKQLRHTAGVFQAQHRLLVQEQGAVQNGTREEYEKDEMHDGFDFRSIVPNGVGRGYDGIIDIPQRYSVMNREIANQQNDLTQQRDALARTEARLQDFHRRLHAVVAKYSDELLPQEELEFYASDTPSAIFKHLDRMDQGLGLMETAPPKSADSEITKAKVGQLSRLMGGVLDDSMAAERQPRRPREGHDVLSSLTYLEDGLHALKGHQLNLHGHIDELQLKGANQDEEVQRCTDALHRLWDTLISGERRLAALRTPDTEDESPFGYDAFEEDQEQGTSFSIPSTLTKTRRLCDRAARLCEQKVTLRNQLHQERDRSIKRGSMLGAERDRLVESHETLRGEHRDLIEELNATREQHLMGQKAYEHKQAQLDDVKAELEQTTEELQTERGKYHAASKEFGAARSGHENIKQELSSQLDARMAQIGNLEREIHSHAASLETARSAHQHAEASRDAVEEELNTTRHAHGAALQDLQLQLSAREAEINNLEGVLASHDANFSSIQSAYQDANASRRAIQEELDTTRHTHELTLQDLHSQLTAREAEINNLEGILASHDANFSSIQSAYQDANALQHAIQEELDNTRDAYEITVMDLQSQLSAREAEINNLEGVLASHDANFSSIQSAYQDADASRLQIRELLTECEADLSTLQTSHAEAQQSLVDARAQVAQLQQASTAASDHATFLQAQLDAHTASLATLESEKLSLETEVARLITSSTFARAELDTVQGSRAQRAASAEVAVQKQLGELAELTARNADLTHHVEALKFHGERAEILERELAELVDEYEVLVQAGVAGERERQELEANLDAVVAKVEMLEVRLSEERVSGMARGGGRSAFGKSANANANGVNGTITTTTRHGQKGSEDSVDGVGGAVERRMESTVVSVMRAEFKKMMREARAEYFRGLKVRRFLFLLSLFFCVFLLRRVLLSSYLVNPRARPLRPLLFFIS